MYPNLTDKVQTKQLKQKEHHDTSKRVRTFSVGDSVFAEMFGTSAHTLLPGSVVRLTGPLSYIVELSDGRFIRRHIDNIRIRTCVNRTDSFDYLSDLNLPDCPPPPTTRPSVASSQPLTVSVRRSSRARRPPTRFSDSQT